MRNTACKLTLAMIALPGYAAQADHMAPTLSREAQRQLLGEYCVDCHNTSDFAGGLELEYFDPAEAATSAATTEKVVRKLRAGMMPPAGNPRPAAAQLTALAASLESTIDAAARPRRDVPQLHRLNRAEYANAVRDLLGVELDSTQFLPADDVSRGFDNQAGALSLSPALLEAYLSAASRIARLAMGSETSPRQVTYRVPEDANQNYHIDGLPLGTRGGLLVRHLFPADGQYQLRIFAVNLGNMGNFSPFGEIRGEKLLVYVDGQRVATLDWDSELKVRRPFGAGNDSDSDNEPDAAAAAEQGFSGGLRSIDLSVPLAAGAHEVGVTFAATQFAPVLDLNRQFERSTIETGGIPGFTFFPHVGSVRIDGPEDGRPPQESASRARILACQPRSAAEEPACARQIATTLAHRAYRGKSTPQDVEALLQFHADARLGGSFDDGVEAMVQRVLADPKFLYRIESAPEQQGRAAWRIDDLDLASRLSFFLWSSIPDDELLRLAQQRKLGRPGELRTQVRRMLDDPRASALTANFAGQWLGLRNLTGHAPLVDQFPDFDDNLRQAFRREVELLFDSLLAEDRSVLDLLTADYSFLNERLAKHYGIPGIRGSHFRQVQLGSEHAVRHGLLGKGAILTVSSQPGRTSPVIRGNWVLRTLLGVPAPDPPPDVPELKAPAADAAGNLRQPTMREHLTRHRDDAACRGCHMLMDPIGFALESFDAIGQYRTHEAGSPIDTRDTLYDGTPVDGMQGLREFLLRYREQYVRNFAQNLLTYAIGRGMDHDDMPTVRAVTNEAAAGGYRLRGLIEAVVLSELFRMNAPAPPAAAAMTASRKEMP